MLSREVVLWTSVSCRFKTRVNSLRKLSETVTSFDGVRSDSRKPHVATNNTEISLPRDFELFQDRSWVMAVCVS